MSDPGSAAGPPSLLALDGVDAAYGDTRVLRDVSLDVPAGRIVALLGPNGAGKTTLLRVAAGLLKPTAGVVRARGLDITDSPPHVRARVGICLVPEGRGVFGRLTVFENLRMLTPPWVSKADRLSAYDAVFETFPMIARFRDRTAGTLSGGQQQMLAIARAYLASPDVVMLDEVSMGLAPKIVDEIFESLRRLAQKGVSLLLVEQYVTRALELADDVVLLDRGDVTFAGPSSKLSEDAVLRGYLGLNGDSAPVTALI